jgi:hypothetical protein
MGEGGKWWEEGKGDKKVGKEAELQCGCMVWVCWVVAGYFAGGVDVKGGMVDKLAMVMQ